MRQAYICLCCCSSLEFGLFTGYAIPIPCNLILILIFMNGVRIQSKIKKINLLSYFHFPDIFSWCKRSLPRYLRRFGFSMELFNELSLSRFLFLN